MMVHSGVCCQRVTFVRLIWQNGGPSVHQSGPSIKPSNYPCSSIHPTKIRTKFGINHLSLSLKFKARIHEEAIISSPRSHARHANWLRAGFRTPSTCTKCCWCRERERDHCCSDGSHERPMTSSFMNSGVGMGQQREYIQVVRTH